MDHETSPNEGRDAGEIPAGSLPPESPAYAGPPAQAVAPDLSIDPMVAAFIARLRRPTPVTIALLLINLLLGAAVTVDTSVFDNPSSLIELGAKDRLLIDGGDWWRLITAAFLHHGVFHLLINGYGLWVLGRFCEAMFGSSRFLLIYLGAALGGSLASTYLTAERAVGASGAIFGLLGAALVFAFRHRDEIPHFFGRRLRGSLLFWLAVNLALGALIPLVDNWGHLGGLVAGTLLALLLGDEAFKQRSSTPSTRAAVMGGAATVGAVAVAVAIALGVSNRANVAYPTLENWAAATELLEEGKNASALELLDQARAGARGGEPWLMVVHLDRARALARGGDRDLAESTVDSAAARKVDLARLRYPWALEAALRFAEFERYREAERLYRRVVRSRRNPSALNNLAWLYLTAEDPEFQRPAEALPFAEKAVRAEPTNPFFLGTLGTAQLRLGHYRPALENLMKAVELHQPGDEGSDLYLLAIALARMGRGEEARAVLSEAQSRFPEDRFRAPAERAVRQPAVSL